MTDEEQKKLIAALRQKGLTGPVRVPMCAEAADEIEQLAGRLQTTLVMYGERNKEIERLANEVETLKKFLAYADKELLAYAEREWERFNV
jgi:HAMP domain-containing protein